MAAVDRPSAGASESEGEVSEAEKIAQALEAMPAKDQERYTYVIGFGKTNRRERTIGPREIARMLRAHESESQCYGMVGKELGDLVDRFQKIFRHLLTD